MGKCGMLQSTGLQRVGHELATEQIIILLISPCPDFHNFMISLENRYCKKKKKKKNRYCKSFSYSTNTKIVWGFLGLLHFHKNFGITLPTSTIGILIGIALNHWILTEVSGDIFGCLIQEVLLESSRQRPEELLNILQCTEQPLTTNVNCSAAKKTYSEYIGHFRRNDIVNGIF